jgi:hypothetical protein
MAAVGREDRYGRRAVSEEETRLGMLALSCVRPSRRLSDRAPNGIAAGRRVERLSRSSKRAHLFQGPLSLFPFGFAALMIREACTLCGLVPTFLPRASPNIS